MQFGSPILICIWKQTYVCTHIWPERLGTTGATAINKFQRQVPQPQRSPQDETFIQVITKHKNFMRRASLSRTPNISKCDADLSKFLRDFIPIIILILVHINGNVSVFFLLSLFCACVCVFVRVRCVFV